MGRKTCARHWLDAQKRLARPPPRSGLEQRSASGCEPAREIARTGPCPPRMPGRIISLATTAPDASAKLNPMPESTSKPTAAEVDDVGQRILSLRRRIGRRELGRAVGTKARVDDGIDNAPPCRERRGWARRKYQGSWRTTEERCRAKARSAHDVISRFRHRRADRRQRSPIIDRIPAPRRLPAAANPVTYAHLPATGAPGAVLRLTPWRLNTRADNSMEPL